MITILDTIVERKRMEVLKRKGRKPLNLLQQMPHYDRTPLKPASFLPEGIPGIIAEFKRRSPSKGVISSVIDPVEVVKSYSEAGAFTSSILTDRDFFGGSFKDLEAVKTALPGFPLLRKDFMIDPYQLHEAKAYGADMILLIAAILTPSEVKQFTELAMDLGLSVLLEVHTEEEIGHWYPGIDLVGVNNRDLKAFKVDIERSERLLEKLPKEVTKVSESGLGDPQVIRKLYESGYDAFLMGEAFMRTDDPGKALRELMGKLNN